MAPIGAPTSVIIEVNSTDFLELDREVWTLSLCLHLIVSFPILILDVGVNESGHVRFEAAELNCVVEFADTDGLEFGGCPRKAMQVAKLSFMLVKGTIQVIQLWPINRSNLMLLSSSSACVKLRGCGIRVQCRLQGEQVREATYFLTSYNFRDYAFFILRSRAPQALRLLSSAKVIQVARVVEPRSHAKIYVKTETNNGIQEVEVEDEIRIWASEVIYCWANNTMQAVLWLKSFCDGLSDRSNQGRAASTTVRMKTIEPPLSKVFCGHVASPWAISYSLLQPRFDIVNDIILYHLHDKWSMHHLFANLFEFTITLASLILFATGFLHTSFRYFDAPEVQKSEAILSERLFHLLSRLGPKNDLFPIWYFLFAHEAVVDASLSHQRFPRNRQMKANWHSIQQGTRSRKMKPNMEGEEPLDERFGVKFWRLTEPYSTPAGMNESELPSVTVRLMRLQLLQTFLLQRSNSLIYLLLASNIASIVTMSMLNSTNTTDSNGYVLLNTIPAGELIRTAKTATLDNDYDEKETQYTRYLNSTSCRYLENMPLTGNNGAKV
ncbi:uncharacterized protein BDR25DRAFT_350871 [Lindgomyces ingoldianus]|uniref:Uncharacterized protein n=1 Tax=Lindgomyces ingoldianus TaxID=673940 RepID=A0ACB6RB07_9PLEO|nr:uncharacterized protein BDR25DRAFT_350871 [Lindgomyces ingoldianus]KAF2475522.1 hypothetical protein BDR25DRAFT_350871 [Lindgomyces ingoldianus]